MAWPIPIAMPFVIKAIWQPLHRDLIETSYPTLYNSYTARRTARSDVSQRLDQSDCSRWPRLASTSYSRWLTHRVNCR
jgi:hypothetical protein